MSGQKENEETKNKNKEKKKEEERKEKDHKTNEKKYAREVLMKFMRRAWRREIAEAEIDQKLALFEKLRPQCNDFQEAMIEVLATVLSSPKFLYLALASEPSDEGSQRISDFVLASRLSFFLWGSLPDTQLLDLAANGKLRDQGVLKEQTLRLLADPKADRFSLHFTRQWLGLELLDFLKFLEFH